MKFSPSAVDVVFFLSRHKPRMENKHRISMFIKKVLPARAKLSPQPRETHLHGERVRQEFHNLLP
jgi:hypothetical protein